MSKPKRTPVMQRAALALPTLTEAQRALLLALAARPYYWHKRSDAGNFMTLRALAVRDLVQIHDFSGKVRLTALGRACARQMQAAALTEPIHDTESEDA